MFIFSDSWRKLLCEGTSYAKLQYFTRFYLKLCKFQMTSVFGFVSMGTRHKIDRRKFFVPPIGCTYLNFKGDIFPKTPQLRF